MRTYFFSHKDAKGRLETDTKDLKNTLEVFNHYFSVNCFFVNNGIHLSQLETNKQTGGKFYFEPILLI